MARYSKIYENGIEKHELVFRGTSFAFSMVPTKYGTHSDKAGFDEQIHEKFPNISMKRLEEIGVDDLWIENDEDDIFEILNKLEALKI